MLGHGDSPRGKFLANRLQRFRGDSGAIPPPSVNQNLSSCCIVWGLDMQHETSRDQCSVEGLSLAGQQPLKTRPTKSTETFARRSSKSPGSEGRA